MEPHAGAFYYHLISEKLVAMVVNGSERVGGGLLELEHKLGGGFMGNQKTTKLCLCTQCKQTCTIIITTAIVLHHIIMV